MILPYLIFAHLVADFILQPASLVRWKMVSKKGVFVHVLVHFLVNFVILLPFLMKGYYWLLIVILYISFAHFWIDEAKINYDLTHDKKTKPFVVDQLLHLLAILLAFFFIGEIPLELPNTRFHEVYSNINIIIFLSFLIFISSAIEIYRFQKEKDKNKKAKLKIFSQKVLTRIIVFTLVYAFFVVLAFYSSSLSA